MHCEIIPHYLFSIVLSVVANSSKVYVSNASTNKNQVGLYLLRVVSISEHIFGQSTSRKQSHLGSLAIFLRRSVGIKSFYLLHKSPTME